jgi:ribosomal protein S18 acetylase RimI-like enzyme
MNNISYEYRPATDKEREHTALHLRLHTEAAVGMPVTHLPFGLLAYADNQLAGSIVGKIFFHWLHIDLIWVDDKHQRKGIGSNLMALAMEKAREMKLKGIEVWTQSWQAPGFYRKLGYEEFAVIDDFTPGRKRHAFRLHLEKAVS